MAWKGLFTDVYIREILRTLYGITPSCVQELPGYDDINVKVHTGNNNTQPGLGADRTLVLKIIKMKHSLEERRYALQDRILVYLRENDIPVPIPVPTKFEEFHSLCPSSKSEKTLDYCIRALEYVPGSLLSEVDFPDEMVYDAGRLTGKMDRLLQDFEIDSLMFVDLCLEMSRFPDLRSRVPLCCHDDTTILAYELFDKFDVKIKPVLDKFKKGYIHGDIRGDNIIVETTENSDCLQKYKLSCVIDFGDVCLSYYIFEIAVFMADLICMSLETNDPFRHARLALSGYREEFVLYSLELTCLRLSICIRLMGLYIVCSEDAEKDPTNEAIVRNIHKQLAACQFVWKISDEDFHQIMIL